MDTQTHTPPPPPHADVGLADLLRQLRDEAELLVRQEVKLARQETQEMVRHYIRASMALLAGALILHAAFLVLLWTIGTSLMSAFEAWGMDEHLLVWLAPLSVAVVTGIVGFILLQQGKAKLADSRARPEKTAKTLKEDQQWAQSKIKTAMS
ncbi:MAG: phage holin family protein [Verrucomicrobiota bacterium JB022]|nr:phage holin family protein [Verrucomicrobiota bacterium JB022]